MTPEGLKDIEKIPEWLDILAQRLESSQITEPKFYCNHYLINEYNGPSGIMPHTDGPLYHPYVTVISIGSPVLFKIFKSMNDYKADSELANMLIEPNSLYIFTDEYYKEYLHAIKDHKVDTVKVTYRANFSGVAGARKVERVDSSVHNLSLTGLYAEYLSRLEETEFEGFGELNQYLSDLATQGGDQYKIIYKFGNDVESPTESTEPDTKFSLYFTWERGCRISLTIRHVWPALE